MRIFLLLLTLLCVTLSQVVQYKITYSIANANNAGSEDSQYVKITGSEGETEEQECESADFDNPGEEAECFIESDINIGDYGCVHLRTGGRNGLDLIKVKVEIDGTEVHTILPQDGDRYIELDDYGKKVFCKVGSSSTVEVCEKKNHLASIDCGEGVIEVEDAVYGVHSNDNTCGVELSRGDGKCEAATSLQEVQDKCDGESFCRLEAKNGIFGDPCPGVAKYLTVTWKCNSLIGEDGPQGDPGPQGLPGAVGDKGSQGTNDFCSSPSPTICSLEGVQGEAGDDGSDGNDGLKGDQGPQGEQGERGRDGVDGDNGAQGEPGEDGEDGENGEDGVKGIDGMNGEDGVKGIDGMNGEQNCEAKSCAGLKLGRCYGASSATLTVQCREGYGAASIWKNTRFWGLKCCKFVVK